MTRVSSITMAAASALLVIALTAGTISSFSVSVPATRSESFTSITTNRKLKESGYNQRGGSISLEDYHYIEPAPSSKAAINTGPIEHGTPLMPYIPQPTPPAHPKHGGSP